MNTNPVKTARPAPMPRPLPRLAACAALLLLIVAAQPGRAATNIVTFSNTNLVSWSDFYADASPYPSSILTSNLTGTLQKVTVTLGGLGEVQPEGIEMLLAGPSDSGVALDLMFGDGGDIAVTNLTVVLDDAAATSIAGVSRLSTGTFKPNGTNNNSSAQFNEDNSTLPNTNDLAGFIGTDLNGTWNLEIFYDDVPPSGSPTGALTGGWSLNFYMEVDPPSTATQAATNITTTNAVLTAAVNPNGAAAQVYFEWGSTTNYGNFSATNTLSTNLNTLQQVTAAIGYLQAASTTHYQAVAANFAGTNYGGDLTLTTLPPPILAASLDSNSLPVLTLFGYAGANYNILYTTSLAAPENWQVLTNLTLTNASQTISLAPATNKAEFFQAVQPN
jgi:hypothetical protein